MKLSIIQTLGVKANEVDLGAKCHVCEATLGAGEVVHLAVLDDDDGEFFVFVHPDCLKVNA